MTKLPWTLSSPGVSLCTDEECITKLSWLCPGVESPYSNTRVRWYNSQEQTPDENTYTKLQLLSPNSESSATGGMENSWTNLEGQIWVCCLDIYIHCHQ